MIHLKTTNAMLREVNGAGAKFALPPPKSSIGERNPTR
jgi:hypothetical protein